MISLIFLTALIFGTFSHILMPPYLPIAFKNKYFQQKFQISQIESAEFKISGLPKDIFWTTNGTLFGKPQNSGQWRLNITYSSLTQSGVYLTILTVRDTNTDSSLIQGIANDKNDYSIIFPENLIFTINKKTEIEFKFKNGLEPINWKFITIPKGVQQRQNGKLSVFLENEGIYLLRLEAVDSNKNQLQACVTLNAQNSIQNLSEVYSVDTIYQKSQNMNQLLQITQKENQITKQLVQAAKIMGQTGEILRQNQDSFSRITNNLIQLQQQAKIISLKISTSLKNKNTNSQKLNQAYQILRNAQDSLNLALIEQSSNNNLLGDASQVKKKAQSTYDKAAKDFDVQNQSIASYDAKIQAKFEQKQSSQGIISNKKIAYNNLAQQILTKQKQIPQTSQQIMKIQNQLKALELEIISKKQLLSKQEANYSQINDNKQQNDDQKRQLLISIADFNSKVQSISKEIQDLDSKIKDLKYNQLFEMQFQTQTNNLMSSNVIFNAVNYFSSASYESNITNQFVSKSAFSDCSNDEYPKVQGIFTIAENSLQGRYYKSSTGHKILYGNCTNLYRANIGESVIVFGHAIDGTIHADTIAQY